MYFPAVSPWCGLCQRDFENRKCSRSPRHPWGEEDCLHHPWVSSFWSVLYPLPLKFHISGLDWEGCSGKISLDQSETGYRTFLGTTRSWTPPTWAWRIGQGSLQTLVKTLVEDECFIRRTVCVLKTFSKFSRNIFSNVEQDVRYFPRVCLLLVRWNSGSAW